MEPGPNRWLKRPRELAGCFMQQELQRQGSPTSEICRAHASTPYLKVVKYEVGSDRPGVERVKDQVREGLLDVPMSLI